MSRSAAVSARTETRSDCMLFSSNCPLAISNNFLFPLPVQDSRRLLKRSTRFAFYHSLHAQTVMMGLNLNIPKEQNSQSEQNHWNRCESSETKIPTDFALLFYWHSVVAVVIFVCLSSAASCACFLIKNITNSTLRAEVPSSYPRGDRERFPPLSRSPGTTACMVSELARGFSSCDPLSFARFFSVFVRIRDPRTFDPHLFNIKEILL